MADRNYYVICDDNCKFEGMTKEQILAAIAEVTGATPTQIDDAFITKIKEQNRNSPLKFWVGTNAQYNELTPVDGVFYIITDADPLTDIQSQIDGLDTQITAAGTLLNYVGEEVATLMANGTDTLIADDNGWTVQKFANGLVQAWTNSTITIESGANNSQDITLPSSIDLAYSMKGFVHATSIAIDAPAYFVRASAGGDVTCYLSRKNTTNIGYYDVFIVGRWK